MILFLWRGRLLVCLVIIVRPDGAKFAGARERWDIRQRRFVIRKF
jgi:hypothetical protein